MTDTTLAERLARCVRKSEWTKDARYPETIDAVPAYCIVPDKGTERYRFWMGSNDWSVGFWPTPEAAKAAAQADYTARILAALDMDALAQEVEAMVGEGYCDGFAAAVEVVRTMRTHYSWGPKATADYGVQCERQLF
jgi:hypothetical protein